MASAGDIIAVSGGPDSVYLLYKVLSSNRSRSAILAHFNHGSRGEDSEKDQKFVERIARRTGMTLEKRKIALNRPWTGFERKARKARYAFLLECREKHGADRILVAHTADDQVETVLMRILEGAGVSGLKGIPRKTPDGVERPILDVWREDILNYLHQHKIPYRVDRSNFDTRFERNWIRHVLLPLLEKRYGKSVKKRIFALGERFREVDDLLEDTSRKWLKRHLTVVSAAGARRGGRGMVSAGWAGSFARKSFSQLPRVVRLKVLQLLCFERAHVSPNERLLKSMDRLVVSGGPSAKLDIGKGAALSCRYGEAILRPGAGDPQGEDRERTGTGRSSAAGKAPRGSRSLARKRARTQARTDREDSVVLLDGPGEYPIGRVSGERGDAGEDLFPWIQWEEKTGGFSAARAKKLATGENAAAFAEADLSVPLTVRRLRPGDRVRPFGLDAEKKVKEILIDRKVPREQRQCRPVVCDADGKILWIPGVVRSTHALVSPGTRRTIVLRMAGI